MASSSGSASSSANKETNYIKTFSSSSNSKNIEDPHEEFMFDKMIRESITGTIGNVNCGKVKLRGMNVDTLTISMKVLETYPFDSGLVQGVIQTILETKNNQEESEAPVSYWVLEEFDVIQKDGKITLITKQRRGHPVAREVIPCNETFNIIKEAHLKNNHAGFGELKKILMKKYFFHTICISTFLKVCSICNKDANKMKATETCTAREHNTIDGCDCNESSIYKEDNKPPLDIETHNYEITRKKPKTYGLRKVVAPGQKQMAYSHKVVNLNELISKSQSSFIPELTSNTSSVVADSDVGLSIENSESFSHSNAGKRIKSTPNKIVTTTAPSLATLPKVPKTSTMSKRMFKVTNTDTSSCFSKLKIMPKPASYISTTTNTVTSSRFSKFKTTPTAANFTQNLDKFKHCRAELIPIPETNEAQPSKYKAILLYMDNVSKYTLLRPLRSHSVDELTLELYKVFADFSTPEVINTHLYQKPLFNAVLQKMKQPPVNAIYLVESPKHMSNIVQEQVSLLIQKWKAITNCNDWLLGCLEIQKQLNSYRDKDLKPMSNPFYLLFATENAPFINNNKHFDLASIVEAEENGDITNKTFITSRTYSTIADSIVINNIDLSSSSTDDSNGEDNDQVTVIEPEYEQIFGDFKASNASRDEEKNDGEIKIEETELEADKNETEHNVNAVWPLPMKTETYSFQIEEESESSEISSNPKPSVPVAFSFLDEEPESSPKRVKLETVCHECGKEAERPVACVSCSRPVHFNLDCASELDIDEDDNKLKYAKCKTCAKKKQEK